MGFLFQPLFSIAALTLLFEKRDTGKSWIPFDGIGYAFSGTVSSVQYVFVWRQRAQYGGVIDEFDASTLR